MTSRFDNLPTSELVELERQARDDRRHLLALIRDRFQAECGLELGRAYRIKAGRFAGRLMRVQYVTIGGGVPMIHTQVPVFPLAEGPLDKRGGWNNRSQQVPLENLEREPVR